MALMITKQCIVCSSCKDVCPNNAITAGKAIYEIISEMCTECVGIYDEPSCKNLCPVDEAIITNPFHRETRAELLRKQYIIEKMNSCRML
jgi:ferredoxin